MAMQKQKWTISGLALELGVDRRTLGKKLHNLKPIDSSGRIKYYHLADVHKLLTTPEDDEPGNYEQHRTRLAKAQADKTELEVQTLRANLLPAEEVLAEIQNMVTACRARLLAIPTKSAFQISALKTPQEIERFLKSQINEALHELANYAPEIDEAEDE